MSEPTIDAVTYSGEVFAPPAAFAELNITHALCGSHHARGASVLRWLKADLIKTERDQANVISGALALYSGAVTNLRLVEIKKTKKPVQE